MQRRIKWLYGCSSVLFVVFSTLLITLSEPINDTLKDDTYYNIHVYQMAAVTLVLLFGLFYITTRVKLIQDWQTQFVEERRIVRTTVILFAVSYILRILLTLHYVFQVVTL